MEDWEKEKWKTDSAVNRVLFCNKYKDLPLDTGHMYYIHEEDIISRRCYGWVIYAQCAVPGVEVTIFLAVTLLRNTN